VGTVPLIDISVAETHCYIEAKSGYLKALELSIAAVSWNQFVGRLGCVGARIFHLAKVFVLRLSRLTAPHKTLHYYVISMPVSTRTSNNFSFGNEHGRTGQNGHRGRSIRSTRSTYRDLDANAGLVKGGFTERLYPVRTSRRGHGAVSMMQAISGELVAATDYAFNAR
jgi:hypothetical protein